ncbi:MAG: tyrosine-type recombinase/integrase, partial [Lachnospiraceae bacterium]|nr:tyrosine-type recombinase/integrase [Lachnospiraceae bacterium]
ALYEHYFVETLPNDTAQDMFDKMCKEYEVENRIANLTLVHYRADWKKYMVDAGCEWLNIPIRKVLPEQIENHYRRITAGAAIKRSTFNNVKSVVNAVFDYAIIHNIPCTKARNISTRRLKFAQKTDKWEGVYSLADRQKILSVCEELKPTVYTKAIELMFCLDIRIGELRALYKADVDLEHKTVYVGHQMVDVKTDKANRQSIRSDIMKGGQEAGKRTEPLSKRAVSVIQWLFEAYPNTDWLLPSKGYNTPIRLHRFNDNLKRICEKAGIKYYSSHGIRFHVISNLYDEGISEKEIQRLSGHTTSQMTRHYNKTIKSSEDDKIRQILG